MNKKLQMLHSTGERSQHFEHATAYYPALKSAMASYMERTCRNHHWFGGEIGQRRIKKLKVGVAGLGGMGSNIAETLVRLGVGQLRVADPDHIDTSNLNRQVIANRNTLGVTLWEVVASRMEIPPLASRNLHLGREPQTP
jgi:tRNA A37 threonylcarbamoyladenosine dehydratase